MTSYQRELQARIRAIHVAANPDTDLARAERGEQPTPAADLLETTLRLLPSTRTSVAR